MKRLLLPFVFALSLPNALAEPPSFGDWNQIGPDRFWRDLGCKEKLCSYEAWVDLEPSGASQHPKLKGLTSARRVTKIDCEEWKSKCINCGEGKREWREVKEPRSTEAVIAELICPDK